jgi:hypothetical protein
MPVRQALSWRLRRRPAPRPDGQQRWDRAYLHVLQWAQLSAPTQPESDQEDSHDGRPVCTGLNAAPDPHATD